MSAAPEWLCERRSPCTVVLRHRTEPVWIVRYGPVQGLRGKLFHAYQSCVRVPKGRKPWTVDNRHIGPKDGYHTLRDALNAANARIGGAK